MEARQPCRFSSIVLCAGALLGLTLFAARMEATPVLVATSGLVYSDRILDFRNAAVNLSGADFGLNTIFPDNLFDFPQGSQQYAPGTEIELDSFILLDGDPGDGGILKFGGQFYIAVGSLSWTRGRFGSDQS